jgi:hypothetical protein
VRRFLSELVKKVASREKIDTVEPISARDDRIGKSLLRLSDVAGLKGMPKNTVTIKKKLHPPVAFCVAQVGQGYSLLYPRERVDERLRPENFRAKMKCVDSDSDARSSTARLPIKSPPRP